MDVASSAPPSAPSAQRPKRRTKISKAAQHADQIIQGLEAGKSQRQVARSLGISPSSIHDWLNSIEQQKQELARFRTTRVDALSTIQAKSLRVQQIILDDLGRDGLLATLTPAQKGNLLHALVVANGNAYDKERLETGQSTANISALSRMIDTRVSTLYTRSKGKPLDTPSGTSEPIDDNPVLIIEKS